MILTGICGVVTIVLVLCACSYLRICVWLAGRRSLVSEVAESAATSIPRRIWIQVYGVDGRCLAPGMKAIWVPSNGNRELK